MHAAGEMFGAAPFVVVERLRLAGEEPFGPELGGAAIAGDAEAVPAVAGAGWEFGQV
jgi:hypothetical protein